MTPGDALLCYCRPGFEPELAGELSERAALAGHPGYARTERNSGFVEFLGADAGALTRALPFESLIFARQKLTRFAELKGLDPKDRNNAPATVIVQRESIISSTSNTGPGRMRNGSARSIARALRLWR